MHGLAAVLISIAPIVGWQAGGTIELNNLPTSLKPAVAYGATVGWPWGRGRELDVLALYQQTSGSRTDAFGEPLSANVNVLYTQIGGRVYLQPMARTHPYVAGTIGATWVDIDGALAAGPSGALGIGTDVPAGKNVSLRFDARMHLSLANGVTSVQCSGPAGASCSASSSGGAFTQFVGSVGVVFRY